MPTAIFGISDNVLNLVVSLFVLMLVVVWLALIVYTYLDAKRRVSDPFLVGCATIASFIPYLGTAVYTILRPPEFLEDAHERELEIRAAELRVRQLTELSCPNCEYPVEKNYLRCPNCQDRLKDPCPSCGKPVDPRWALCPYCENALEGGRSRRRREGTEKRGADRGGRSEPPPRRSEERKPEERPAPKRREPRATASSPEKPAPPTGAKRQKGSSSREPDPDPRQA